MSNTPKAIHEIYQDAKIRGSVRAVDTAKLIRHRLKGAFPGVKFKVVTSGSALGASIHIVWSGGPDARAVQAVVEPYQGEQFDPMIDLKTQVTAYLMPDGTAALAENPGTQRNAGDIPPSRAFKPTMDAIRVNFWVDTVLCTRRAATAKETA